MQNKFLKDKEELEYRIKEFKEQKKLFENTYNSFNDRINRLNIDIANTKTEKENLILNKAIFAMMNMNLKMGQSDEQINNNIKAKYIDKTYLIMPTSAKSKKIVEKSSTKEQVYTIKLEKSIFIAF
jgi:predicted  nucleic acid-binding Zn-ribbon protein